jgi:hypothetical protein
MARRYELNTFDANWQFKVNRRNLMAGGMVLKVGDPLDKSLFSDRRLRQMFDQRLIVRDERPAGRLRLSAPAGETALQDAASAAPPPPPPLEASAGPAQDPVDSGPAAGAEATPSSRWELAPYKGAWGVYNGQEVVFGPASKFKAAAYLTGLRDAAAQDQV